jgi:hypothetical protein
MQEHTEENFETEDAQEDGRVPSFPRAKRRHEWARLSAKRRGVNLQGQKRRRGADDFRAEAADAPVRVRARAAKNPTGRYSPANPKNPRMTHGLASIGERRALQSALAKN